MGHAPNDVTAPSWLSPFSVCGFLPCVFTPTPKETVLTLCGHCFLLKLLCFHHRPTVPTAMSESATTSPPRTSPSPPSLPSSPSPPSSSLPLSPPPVAPPTTPHFPPLAPPLDPSQTAALTVGLLVCLAVSFALILFAWLRNRRRSPGLTSRNWARAKASEALEAFGKPDRDEDGPAAGEAPIWATELNAAAEQAHEMKVAAEAAELAEEKMLAASERLKVAQAQAATSRLMDMTE